MLKSGLNSSGAEIDTQRDGDGDFQLHVRGVNDGRSPRDVAGDHLLHDIHGTGIERGKGLIENPQWRMFAQRKPRKGDAPPLPL